MDIKGVNQNHSTTQRKLNWIALAKSPVYLFMAIISLLINVSLMNTIWRERRELEQMTTEEMKDIGLDPSQVELECKKGFFNIPDERRKSAFSIGLAGFRREF